jgi:cell division protein FtsB
MEKKPIRFVLDVDENECYDFTSEIARNLTGLVKTEKKPIRFVLDINENECYNFTSEIARNLTGYSENREETYQVYVK